MLQVQSARYTKSVSLGQSALHLTGKFRRNSGRANKWSAVVWTKLSTTGWTNSIIIISLRTLSGLKWALWTMINPCGQLRAKLFLFYSSQLFSETKYRYGVRNIKVLPAPSSMASTRRDVTRRDERCTRPLVVGNYYRVCFSMRWGFPDIGETVASRFTLAEDFYMSNLV